MTAPKVIPTKGYKTRPDDTPVGATRAALDREDNGGGPPGSPLGDPHAAGTPGGGTETGGLAGSNIGDGSPVAEEGRREDQEQEQEAYGGPSGGAVGGTPAEGRASGGHGHGGLAPGGEHRGDSTIGSKPTGARKGSSKRKGNG
jgi:hypothetical protein